jgi:putative addiction module component (TIGR02574 family)
MSLTSIQNEIEKLEPAERAALIDVLWDSLDEAKIKEIEAKWGAESEDRIDAFERGELPAVDGPSALKELRNSLKK